MIFNSEKDYIEDAEFSIKVWKEKGETNTQQEYCYSEKPELLTGICSMIERLITMGKITIEDMEYASKLVIKKLKEEEN